MEAKEEEIDGNGSAMLKFGVQVASITASLVTLGGASGVVSAGEGGWTLVSSGLTLDDMLKIEGDNSTMLESIAAEAFGESGVEGVQILKLTVGIANLAKGQYEINASMSNGKTYQGIYDGLNEIMTGYSLVEDQGKKFMDADYSGK